MRSWLDKTHVDMVVSCGGGTWAVGFDTFLFSPGASGCWGLHHLTTFMVSTW